MSLSDLRNSLVAFWKLDDDASNDEVADDSGLNQTGTADENTANLANIDGKMYDSALEFDTYAHDTDPITGNAVYATKHADLKGLTTFSVSLWIRPTGWGYSWGNPGTRGDQYTGQQGYFLSTFKNDNSEGWLISMLTGTTSGSRALYFGYAHANNVGYWRVESVFPANANSFTWYHVVVTFDDGTITMYFDGSAQTVVNNTAPSGTIAPDTGNLIHIGNRHDLVRGFDGRINQVCVFDRVITSSEVDEIYNEGNGIEDFGTASTSHNVTGSGFNWSVGEGSVTHIADASGDSFTHSVGKGAVTWLQINTGSGHIWSVGDGNAIRISYVSGTGYGQCVGSGQVIKIGLPTGEGFIWSVGVGEAISHKPAAGTGSVWAVGEGVFGKIQPIAGVGYNHVFGEGAAVKQEIGAVSGKGITWSVGVGNTSKFIRAVEGAGFNHSFGSGDVTRITYIEGLGHTHTVGVGEVTHIANASGTGITWIVGEGSSDSDTINTGTGYVWAVGSGEVSLGRVVSGTGLTQSLGSGSTTAIRIVAGSGANWSVGTGSIGRTYLVVGHGATWSVGEATITEETELSAIWAFLMQCSRFPIKRSWWVPIEGLGRKLWR